MNDNKTYNTNNKLILYNAMINWVTETRSYILKKNCIIFIFAMISYRAITIAPITFLVIDSSFSNKNRSHIWEAAQKSVNDSTAQPLLITAISYQETNSYLGWAWEQIDALSVQYIFFPTTYIYTLARIISACVNIPFNMLYVTMVSSFLSRWKESSFPKRV